MYIYINVFLCFGVLIFLEWFPVVNGQVNLCQDNCGTADRLTGPFRNKAILPHPWAETTFATNKVGFCKMGCQFFLVNFQLILHAKDYVILHIDIKLLYNTVI